MSKFVKITIYDKVVHTRQFDDVATFEGVGSGSREIDIALSDVASVEACLGQEADARFRPVRLHDFFTLTTVGGVEHLIDIASRDAIQLAGSAR